MPPAHLRPQVAVGTPLSFTWDPSTFLDPQDPSTPVYAFFINQVADPVYVPAGTAGAGAATVALPANLAGAVFAGLTTKTGMNATELSATSTLAGPQVVILS